MTAQSICLSALEAFARKDFADWHGLPAACPIGTASESFSSEDDSTRTGRLGLNSVETDYRFYRAPSYASPIRVWFRDDAIRLIEAEEPLADLPLPKLARQLGVPTAKLDTWFGFAHLTEGEWVYVTRGISVSSDASRRQIQRLCVFTPTTLQTYTDELRIKVRQTPIPEAPPR